MADVVLDDERVALVRAAIGRLTERLAQCADGIAAVPSRSFGGSAVGIEAAAQRAGALRTQELELRSVVQYLDEVLGAFDAAADDVRTSDEHASDLLHEVLITLSTVADRVGRCAREAF
ncbi:MAG: hypothetical protein PIR53_10190 [Nocardioides alkalitolerans]